MMEIARTVEKKWRELRFNFAVKILDLTWQRAKAQPRAPGCCVDGLERNAVALPRAI